VSVCVPPIVDRQRTGKHVPAATNTSAIIKQLLKVILYAVRVMSNESGRLFLPTLMGVFVCVCVCVCERERERESEYVQSDPSSRQRGGPISNHVKSLGKNKNMVRNPDWT
jgi:hypothetical protein